MNVGATSEEKDGEYFSWGNIAGHASSNGTTFDDGYDFGTSDAGPYASTPGASLSSDIASNNKMYDAALAKLGGSWHMPTKDDYRELYDNTDSEWVNDYNGTGVAGYKFMKKTDHSVYIFFPASGSGSGTSINNRQTVGYYWTSSIFASYTESAYYLGFSSSIVNTQGGNNRYYGCPVRAIKSAN